VLWKKRLSAAWWNPGLMITWRKNRQKYADELSHSSLIHLMKISEPAFEEWNNEEDDVYNDL
jgi:hypothetical protein